MSISPKIGASLAKLSRVELGFSATRMRSEPAKTEVSIAGILDGQISYRHWDDQQQHQQQQQQHHHHRRHHNHHHQQQQQQQQQ